jgi:ferric-dicitrate binding protein FerR (iron transport regulator)
MTDRRPSPDDNAMEARLAVRKAHREAHTQVDRLVERLADVEIHQREARYLLERAGMLTRRARPDGKSP